MKYKSIVRVILPFIFLFVFANCFQILHFLSLNKDGSVDVRWRFTISKALSEMNKKKGGAPSGDKKEEKSIDEKLSGSVDEIQSSLKGIARDVKVEKIDTEFETGIDVSFTATKFAPVENEEEYPILPKYDKAKKQLIFTFKSKEKKDKKEKKEKEKKDKGESEEKASKGGDFGEKLGAVFLSSVKYQIILSGEYQPKEVFMIGKTSGKKKPLKFLKLGANYHLDIPLFAILSKEKAGADIVVQL